MEKKGKKERNGKFPEGIPQVFTGTQVLLVLQRLYAQFVIKPLRSYKLSCPAK